MGSAKKLKVSLLSATIFTGTLTGTAGYAQDANAPAAPHADAATGPTQVADADAGSGEIVVTGTRRATTIQDTPINISAVSGDMLAAQRVDDVRDLAAFTPGITINDTGPRSTGQIIARGINASDTDDSGANYDDALGVYLGEVPLYYDFKLLDLERVETLLGPQGTLYGLGTLAGAIRYIPKRPDATDIHAEAHGRVYAKDHSDKLGYQADLILNIPIVKDHIAFRTVGGYYYDPGFIDYPLVLKNPGTSLPQAGGTGNSIGADYDANLRKVKDVNFDRTYTTRNQLLLEANPDLKAIATYAYQETRTDGRQANSAGVLGTGKYENGSRYVEPVKRSGSLASLELNANLWNIADLVETTALTKVRSHNVGDVSDLLLDLDYDYEAFPAFSGYFTSSTQRKQFNEELRLVSRHGGPFSWSLGGFYNRQKYKSFYFETTPGLADFYGIADDDPRDIEYSSYIRSKLTEKAIFGEGSFKITPKWQVTGGARYFKYTSQITGALVLPLLGDPTSPFDATPAGGETSKSGWVWKFNSSYKFTRDLMLYATYSKGYRVGGPNRVAPCPNPVPEDQQNACALPNEQQYGPDTTKNLEVGVRTQLFDRKLSFDFDVYHIKWQGIQLASATFYGVTGITVNGGSARSQGFEASFTARPIPEFTLQGTYSYTDAKLTSDVPNLITFRTTPGDYDSRPKFTRIDALSGDRLPGSAKNSGSLGATYTYPLGNAQLIGNWTSTYRGSVISRLGYDRAYGDKLPSYVTHRASLTYSTDLFDISLWGNNIFDKYAVTSIGNDRSRIGINDGVAVRYYTRAVLSPRTFGVEGRVKF